MTKNPKERVGWFDYIAVCMAQSMLGAGSADAPKSGNDLFEDFFNGECRLRPAWPSDEYRAAVDLAGELFGLYECRGTGEQLFHVRKLTIKERAIAARMDLSHEEKLELIRPLRAVREVRSVDGRLPEYIPGYVPKNEVRTERGAGFKTFEEWIRGSGMVATIHARALGIKLTEDGVSS